MTEDDLFDTRVMDVFSRAIEGVARIAWPLLICLFWVLAGTTTSEAKGLPKSWPAFDAHPSQVKVLPPLAQSGKTRKFALLVAVEKYGTSFTKDVVGQAWPSLEGAQNDLQLMARELRRRGFAVATLADEHATRDGIVQAMAHSLYGRLTEGRDDVALFYFAGHGQQVRDTSGDEPDGYDEAIVAYDNDGVGGARGRLLDDDLGTMLRLMAARAGNVVVLMDSCHSGGATRGANQLPPGLRPRGGHAPLGDANCAQNCRPDTAGLESGPIPENLVFLSATQSHQLAYEAPSLGPHGAFTYYFTQALNRMPANATYAGLMGQVRTAMSNFKSVQWPSIEGDERRVVLGAKRGEEVQGFWVRKDPKGEDTFIVDGSPASGVVPGAVLSVRAIDAGPRERGVKMRVETMRKGEMVARAVGQTVTTLRALQPIIDEGGVGRVVSAPRGLGVLTLDASAAPPSLRTMLARQPKVARLSPENAELKVVRNADSTLSIRTAAGTHLPLPVCFDAPMKTAVADTTPNAGMALLNGLQYEQRRRRLLAFGVGGRPRGIRAQFAVQSDEGVFQGQRKTRKDVLRAGGDGAVTISNTGSVPFYPYLIEVANDGTVNVLHPNVAEHEVSQAIPPGQSSPPGSLLITAGNLPGDQQYVLIASKDPIDDIGQLGFFPTPVGQCAHHPPTTRGGRSRKRAGAPWALVTKTIKVVESR